MSPWQFVQRAGFACAILHVVSVALWSQAFTAALSGTVVDSTSAVVAGARIRVVNTETNQATVVESDGAGRFVAPSLQPGSYSLTVQVPGFKMLERTGITLRVAQSLELELRLEVGQVTESVEVTGQPPLIESGTSTVGQVIDNRTILNLPLNQRNAFGFVFLAPGVTGNVGFFYNNVNIRINGGRPGSNAILVDGVPAAIPLTNPIQGIAVNPSVDAVAEFKVQSNNYSAEHGRTGGGVINLVYKSGTNEFRGSAFEFLRNSVMDANNFFANQRGQQLASFKRNQFGGTLGGPVILPKLYNGRDKTFFFFSYEGLRERQATDFLTTVPTPLQKNGDFSQTRTGAGAPIIVYDPATTVPSGGAFTRQPFPGNRIPQGRVDKVAANVLRYFPNPTGPGLSNSNQNNYGAAGPRGLDADQYDIKVDQNLNDMNRFFARFSRRTQIQPLIDYFPNDVLIGQGGTSVPVRQHNFAAEYTRSFSPTFLTGVRYGFSRIWVIGEARSLGFDPVQLGFPNYMREGVDALMFPGFQPAGYVSLGQGGAAQFGGGAFDTHFLGVNNSKVAGNHTLRFGFDGRLIRVNLNSGDSPAGTFAFTRSFTQGPNPTAASATAGDSLASFMLGLGSGTLIRNAKNTATQSWYYAGYIQDDWKLTSRLTLNLGLRYEIELPLTERYDRFNVFDPNVTSPLSGPANLPGLRGALRFAGVDLPRSPFGADRNGWAPRIGFAYHLTRKTVMRGGTGIFKGASLRTAAGVLGSTGYNSTTEYVAALDGVTPKTYLSDPFPQGLTPIAGNSGGLLTGVGTPVRAHLTGDNVTPATYSWNLNFQHELPGEILLEAGYIGNRSVNLNSGGEADYSYNQLTAQQLTQGPALLQQVSNPFFGIIKSGPLSGATVPRRVLESPFPHFTQVLLHFPGGSSSIYHSLQMKAEKQFGSGLSFLAAYTFAKSLDDYSRISNVGATAAIQNIYNRRGEWSLSSNDVAQVFVASAVYSLPFGKGRTFGSGWNGVTEAILGGWQMNGILSVQSGLPLAITAQNTSNAGNLGLRPNNIGKSAKTEGDVHSRLNRYFDTSVFAQPAPFSFGNAGRTLPDVRSHGVSNIDYSLFKNFRVTEKTALQFRAEAFNLFNRVQFGAPQTSLASNQFGVVSTQANNPRQIQLALKLLF